VKIRRGPAAVIGDEHRKTPLSTLCGWEGAVSRKIRKPEDLCLYIYPRGLGLKFIHFEDEKWNPLIDLFDQGIFFCMLYICYNSL